MPADLQVFDRGAVVVVKTRDCTIEFTPDQARNFAEALTHYAAEAEAKVGGNR